MMNVLLGLIALTAAGEEVAVSSSATSLQCVAAAEIIRDIVLPSARKAATRDFVFRQNPRVGSSEMLGNRIWADVSGPPSNMLSKLEAQGDVDDVANCPEVRAVLDQEEVSFDQRSNERAARLKRNLESRAIIYGGSLPVLNEDGTQALFIRSMFCGGRCASGELIHARRSAAGKWQMVSEYTLWVS